MPRPPRRRGAGESATAMAPAGAEPLSTLPGVGPKVAEKFAVRGLLSVQDLWLHLPLRYEDRTRITPIAALFPGQSAQVEARVEAVERSFRYRPTLRVAIGGCEDSNLGSPSSQPGASSCWSERRSASASRG